MRKAAVLPAITRAPAPWKNGNGTTYEIDAYPPGSDLNSFTWRISMADVTGESPFSRFEDIDRTLMLLEGELDLAFTNAATVKLRTCGEPHSFKGDDTVIGRAGANGARDLNLMIRAGFASGTIRAMSPQQRDYAFDGEGTLILIATRPALVRMNQARYRLSTWDALRIAAPARLTINTASYWIVVQIEVALPSAAPAKKQSTAVDEHV